METNYQSSFNSGELSGRLKGQSGLEVYKGGCSRLENFFVLPQGGVERRTGTEFVALTNNGAGDKRSKMIPFSFSSTQSYALEIGDGYITVWDDVTPIIVTESSPYLDADFDDLEVFQKFDILYIQSPNKNIYQLNRVTLDPTFTLTEIQYDYPPLLDENETDIEIYPSATIGTVTLTSTQDFFDIGHVGTNMAFSTKRNLGNAAISGSFTTTNITEELYVSNSSWDFATTGEWRGRVIIQRSIDNRINWDDYVVIADTTDVATSPDGRSNFTYESPGQEGVGTWIRMQFIDKDGTISYQIKTNDDWNTLVKIVGYTSPTEVTAEVIDQFQDVPADYPDWVTSTAYVKGDKGKVEGGITYASTSIDLEAIDSGLGDVVGSDFGGGFFWFVTNGASNKKIYKVDSGLTTVEASYDISSRANDGIFDIAWYSNNLYIATKIEDGGIFDPDLFNVDKFTVSGSYVSTEMTDRIGSARGLGYFNNNFYLGSFSESLLTSNTGSAAWKYSSSFIYSGTSVPYSQTADDSKFSDFTGVNNRIYATNYFNDSVDFYNESLTPLGSQDISSQTTAPKGIAWDGSNLWVFGDDGSSVMRAWKYDLISETTYYECTTNHTSGTFSTDFNNGLWSARTPSMTTWKEGAFSEYRGWPRAISFHQDRLWLSGNNAEPNTLFSSVSGDYYNFSTSDLPEGSIRRIPENSELAQWLVGRDRLILGTEGGAVVVKSVDERELIDASNIVTAGQAVFGASSIPAILANDVVIYAERSNKKLRELVYSDEEGNYRSADMNILNNEILGSGAKELFLQQQPDQIIWVIDNNGDAACLTYERVQEVVGWSRFITNGEIESGCRLPKSNSEDEIWMCVNRNGKYTIEKLRSRSDADWYVDSGVEAITGLDHLEGLEVRCLVDGVNDGLYTVSSGAITPNTSGSTYLVGLDYDSIMRTMPIEPSSAERLSNGRVKGAVKAVAEFYPTKGGSIREQHKTGEIFDEVEFVGEKKFNIASDWTREKIIEIKQHLPYPMTILSLAVWTETRGG